LSGELYLLDLNIKHPMPVINVSLNSKALVPVSCDQCFTSSLNLNDYMIKHIDLHKFYLNHVFDKYNHLDLNIDKCMETSTLIIFNKGKEDVSNSR